MESHLLERDRALGRLGRVQDRIRARIHLRVRVRVTGSGRRRAPRGLGTRIRRASASASARTAARAQSLPPGGAGSVLCRRHPPVFCGLDAARARPVMSAYLSRIGGSVTCGRGRGRVVAAAVARENSHCTPLVFVTRHLDLLWRPTHLRCILASSNASNIRASHLPTLPCPRAFLDEFVSHNALMVPPAGNITSSCEPARSSVVREIDVYSLRPIGKSL